MVKKIALIAHDFPPYNAGGSQRPYQMAIALGQRGYQIVVFTLKEEHYPFNKINFNYNTEGIFKINRTHTERKSSSILNTDSHYFNLVDDVASRWKRYLIEAIKEESETVNFDLFIFTCPPFSLAKIASSISRRFEVPYALDFRDAWSQWILSPYATVLHYLLLKRYENKALNNALFVTSTSRQQMKDFIQVHENNFEGKFVYCPNGFKKYLSIPQDAGDRIKIVYIGNFYYNPYTQSLQDKKWYKKKWFQILQYLPRKEDWSYRSPLYFFKILSRIKEINPNMFNRLEIIFAGDKPDWFDNMVGDFNLGNKITHLGFLNKDEIKELIGKANYLLITSSKVPGGREYSVAGKTFEYLSYQKPIIGLLCDGEQRDILNKSGNTLVINPDKTEVGARDVINLLENSISLTIDKSYCDQFIYPRNFTNLFKKLDTL